MILTPILSTFIAGVATWVTLAAKLEVEVATLSRDNERIERRLEYATETFKTDLTERMMRLERQITERTSNRFTSDDAGELEEKLTTQMNLVNQILAERVQVLSERLRRQESISVPPTPPY